MNLMRILNLDQRRWRNGIARRYVHLFSLLGAGTFLALLGYPILDAIGLGVSNYLEKFDPAFVYAHCLALTLTLWLILYALGGWHPKHFCCAPNIKFFASYPPTWLAGFGGTILYLLLLNLVTNPSGHSSLSATVVILSFVFVLFGTLFATGCLFFYGLMRDAKSESSDTIRSGKLDKSTFQNEDHKRLFQWLDRNEPIEIADEDLFDLRKPVERIAARLSVTKTFGIVGPYGSGKSSLRKMIERHLEQKHIWSCVIEGWGLDPSGAPERVLRSVVARLSQHVDSLAIAGLPARYTAALRATGYKLADIASEFLPSPATKSLLELDALLSAVDRKLVIFLEDLDRNANPETLESIAPLLDRLRALTQVTFVLAIQAEAGAKADLLRLCDYVEVMKPLSGPTVAEKLNLFQSHCCESAFPNDIDPIDAAERHDSLFKSSDPIAAFFSRARGEANLSRLVTYLTRLLDTPRKLKSALRQTWFAWERLHGEVEFQFVLVAFAIRIGAPEAWDFIIRRFDAIRAIGDPGINAWLSQERKKQSNEKGRELEHRLYEQSIVSASWDKDTVSALIEFLFQGWLEGPIIPRMKSVQSPSDYSTTDYWRRILSEAVDDSPTDQYFLRSLNGWKERPRHYHTRPHRRHARIQRPGSDALATPPSSLALSGENGFQTVEGSFTNLLLDDERAPRMLEQFGSQFNDQQIMLLAGDLIFASIRRLGAQACFNAFEANSAIWRLATRRGHTKLGEFTRTQIAEVITKSLQFAIDIEQLWGSRDYGRADALRQTRIRLYIRLLCLHELKTAVAWCRALMHGTMQSLFTLRHLIRHEHLSSNAERLDDVSPSWWQWLVPLLLEANESNPKLISPMIGVLISAITRDPPRESTYQIDRGFLAALCPDPRLSKRILVVVASEHDLSDWDPQVPKIARQLRNDAIRVLGSAS